MRDIIVKLFLLLIVCGFAQAATAQTLNFSRPTITAVALKDAPFYHQKIYEDDDYLFAYRHYDRGKYTPGFFAYGKKQKKWIEIKKISTEHAKLGRYIPFILTGEKDQETGMEKAVKNPSVPILSVTWDYSSLKNFEYADVPLDPILPIGLPDNIENRKDQKAYLLNFGAVYTIEEMRTRFWALKADIRKAFRQ